MKVLIRNLGVLKEAEFELGDMTLICGENNTGKTYATYALFGFLLSWQRFLNAEVSNREVEELLTNGVTRIDITKHARKAKTILSQGCRRYAQELPRIFASESKNFKETQFQVKLELDVESVLFPAFERKIRSKKGELFSLSKARGSHDLVASLSADTEQIELPRGMIEDIMSDIINEIIFGQHFPDPFISSAERTGAAIFSKELNFARNRLLEEMGRTDRDIDPMELLLKSYDDYALPVKANVDFTRRITSISKEDSFIAEKHPEILNEFADIIGGEYISSSNDTVYFKPKSNKRLKLAMGESSSAVRSMLDIGSYLHHVAKPGDLLMIDEPELSLHPENQRRVAKLFAKLLNLGIKIFITTHSDYIIKEFNTLIMLNQDKPYLRRIANREDYRSEELIHPGKVKAYVAEKALIKTKSNSKRKSRHLTLIAASVSSEQGIDARSFDKTINKMNEIQEAIVWGGDE